jgi:hypothetical protein
MVQRSSEGCSVAPKAVALLRGFSVTIMAQLSSDRVQRSSEGCSLAQKGAAKLGGCSFARIWCGVAQLNAA